MDILALDLPIPGKLQVILLEFFVIGTREPLASSTEILKLFALVLEFCLQLRALFLKFRVGLIKSLDRSVTLLRQFNFLLFKVSTFRFHPLTLRGKVGNALSHLALFVLFFA